MKLAVIQMMYPKGHKRLDEEFVRILSIQHQLIVVDDGEYFPNDLFDNQNIERITLSQPSVKRWEPLKRFFRRLNLLMVLWKLRKMQYDHLLFLNVHNVIYGLEGWLPQKNRTIIHHYDVDALFADKKLLKEFLKVKETFNHVFLADYIGEAFSQDTGLDSRFVYTIHQPLVFNKTGNKAEKEHLLVGIGNSMCESFIDESILHDSGEELPSRLILRSKIKEYQGKNLTVIKGYLPREQYEGLYDKAKVSVVNYPSSYKYRYSGIIDDSLAKGLVVFCNDTLCGRYFSKKYSHSVFIIDGADELWNLMRTPLPSQPMNELLDFQERHSTTFVLNQFNTVLNSRQ